MAESLTVIVIAIAAERVKRLLTDVSGPDVSSAVAAIKALLALIKEGTGDKDI